jgi:CheY-like chemotaxis protein
MMNGKIWVTSQEGVGSTFFFTVEVQSAAGHQRKGRVNPQMDLRDKRILVVDDNTTNRRILTLQLQAWNMQPKVSASPLEALRWVRGGEVFDAAVLDMEMAEMDGIALAIALHDIPGSTMPMIMLSSLDQSVPQDQQQLFSAVLTKPVKASHLYNALIAVFASEMEQYLLQEPAALPQFDPQMGERHPLRILIVEDNAINQRLVSLMLERMGYRADVAANGIESLQAVHRQTYDALLMDIQMPEMDGFEATRRIRQDIPITDQPRIIAMTANAMRGDREACLIAGMDDYISKPIHIEDLVDTLNRCQPREIRDQSLAGIFPVKKEVFAQNFEGTEAMIDIRELERLRDTLGPRSQEMLPSLVSSFFKQAEKLIEDARAALEADRSEDLRRSAHTLKSNSAIFGARQLEASARELENIARSGILDSAAELLHRIGEEYHQLRQVLLEAQENVLKAGTNPES